MEKAIRLYELGKYQEALDRLLDSDVDSDDYTELSYYLGLCYTQLEQYDEALLYLEQVVTADVSFAKAYQSRMILGYIYAVTGRYRLAEFEFARLLEDGYESPKVYSALAYNQYHQNNIPAAVTNLQKALQLDPDNPTALNNLGYVLADRGAKPELAIKYCKEAVKHKPESATYLDSLGWAAYKAGQREHARKLLKRAMELRPDDEEIRRHMEQVEGKEAV